VTEVAIWQDLTQIRAVETLAMSLILRSDVHKLKFCKCLIGMLPSGSFPGGSQSVPLIKSASNASLFMTRKEEGGKDIDALGQLFTPDVGSKPLDYKMLGAWIQIKNRKVMQ